MMSTSTVHLNNLMILFFSDLACCTQLPSRLCQLPYLQFLQVNHAPSIKRVGTEFLQAVVAAPFPRLNTMTLSKMLEWEEWEWEDQVQAMPRLEKLRLINCKLRHVPPGLASNTRALKQLTLQYVQQLCYIGSFPSVVELTVNGCPDLKRITNLPNLQKLTITDCPKLEVLECIVSLERLVLEDYTMEKLPEYMQDIKPRHLQLFCRLWLLYAVAAGQSSTEWDKFSQVEHVKAYARDGDNQRKWYVLYTRGDNCKLDSNISSSTIFEETLSSCMVDRRGFESLCKMRRSTFSYVCSLVRISFFENMMARELTFVDGRVLSLQDRVAVALRMLTSGEPPVTVGSSLGVSESTCLLVTKVFVEAMHEPSVHNFKWPGSYPMEKIKLKFDKIHGLPNCCGVVHTAQITFGSQDRDGEGNEPVLMRAIVDPDMRFTKVWLASDLLELDSGLLKYYEEDVVVNGSKLKLSDGSEDGDYIIGDAGYPIHPWILTPYLLEDGLSLSEAKVEFNRRHFAVTAFALRALAKLKDTWKCLQGEGWHPDNDILKRTIWVCCRLHNIVIDMEEKEKDDDQEEGEYEDEGHDESCIRQVQVEDEDAVEVRGALSQHLIKSVEEEQGAEDKNKEEEARRRQTADRGKEKVHDSYALSGNGGRVMLWHESKDGPGKKSVVHCELSADYFYCDLYLRFYAVERTQ
ncbi:unnamed protein product [Triticum turgidum subsp. durum]|uniref:DDE Tnp4 domain-containing protein n=1 Tax=Triticum turgidum subsp. durum TaxID=4567 RepID=A0A9R1AE81_TRITD|nr:unnamed protein product [Triticum turgidum subsp. durum]